MNIKKIALNNFKCFESINLELPKITILTGANSSGKSSLIYALLAPFQSEYFPFFLSPNGAYVNMADFREMVYCKDIKKKIRLDLTLNIPGEGEYDYQTEWIYNTKTSLPELNRVIAKIPYIELSIERSEKDLVYILNLKHNFRGYSESRDFKMDQLMKSFFVNMRKFVNEETPKKRKKKILSKDMFELKDIKNKKYKKLDSILNLLMGILSIHTTRFFSTLSNFNSNLNFISSFRIEPERTYYQRTKFNEKITRSGENYIDQILEWETSDSKEFRILNNHLKKFDLLNKLTTRRLKGGRFEINVQMKKSSIYTSLNDVGFGISQLLPVIVADLQLPNKSTLAIAQPEIHLHPSIQADLANFFVTQSKTKGKRYIIETHSEYLLNRIRLLIAKNELEPSDVGIYYFQRSGCKSKAHKVLFRKDGKIEGAPQDFFKTYMIDVLDIALNAK